MATPEKDEPFAEGAAILFPPCASGSLMFFWPFFISCFRIVACFGLGFGLPRLQSRAVMSSQERSRAVMSTSITQFPSSASRPCEISDFEPLFGILESPPGLTEESGWDSLHPPPKSGLIPEAGCGRPNFLGTPRMGRRDFGNEEPRPLSRPSPSANLVGHWKGNPLEPPAGGFHDSQTQTVYRSTI